MESRYEKYLPNATHVFSYVPGSNRTKRAGAYRLFKSSGTWGDNGINLKVPVKQLNAGTFVSQRGISNYRTKIPRKNGISGKEANLIPVGGNVMRVIGTQDDEYMDYRPGSFIGGGMNPDGSATDRRVPLSAYPDPPYSEKDKPPPPYSERDKPPPPYSEKDKPPPPYSERDKPPPPYSEKDKPPPYTPFPLESIVVPRIPTRLPDIPGYENVPIPVAQRPRVEIQRPSLPFYPQIPSRLNPLGKYPLYPRFNNNS
jgi:hypothetical protein